MSPVGSSLCFWIPWLVLDLRDKSISDINISAQFFLLLPWLWQIPLPLAKAFTSLLGRTSSSNLVFCLQYHVLASWIFVDDLNFLM